MLGLFQPSAGFRTDAGLLGHLTRLRRLQVDLAILQVFDLLREEADEVKMIVKCYKMQ